MMGSLTRKFPEAIRAEEQQILKGLVDSSFDDFKQIVLGGRPAARQSRSPEHRLHRRIFTAKQAKENLLVDRIGFIEDAIDRAIELANLDKKDVRVIKFHKPQGLMDLMLSGSESRRQAFDARALLELTVPRAYYLFSWTPGGSE